MVIEYIILKTDWIILLFMFSYMLNLPLVSQLYIITLKGGFRNIEHMYIGIVFWYNLVLTCLILFPHCDNIFMKSMDWFITSFIVFND